MKNRFPQPLYFTRAERAGTALLVLICTAGALFPWFIPRLFTPAPIDYSDFERSITAFFDTTSSSVRLFEFDPNTATAEEFSALGLSEKTAASIIRYREKGGKFRSPDELRKIYTLPEATFLQLEPYIRIGSRPAGVRDPAENENAEPSPPQAFPFDPNTASANEFRQLGLPPWMAQRIVRYRDKGGRFRSAEDFKRVYGLDESDFLRLQPFIRIEAPAPAATAQAWMPKMYAYTPAKESPVIDINNADADAWQQLPGIGEGRAGQILRFRDRLGGFVSVEQVAETRGLPDSVFQKIRPWLRVSPVQPGLHINNIGEADLSRHPYFSGKQAAILVAYREHHGPYADLQALAQALPGCDPAWLRKIAPYLRFD